MIIKHDYNHYIFVLKVIVCVHTHILTAVNLFSSLKAELYIQTVLSGDKM